MLDEIGEMPPALQVNLLRALQERQITPVGATQPISFDTRIICATHRDLEHEITQGQFREDLYYRINVMQMDIPPLRNRRDDIPLLAKHFLEQEANKANRQDLCLAPQTLKLLMGYSWPGNVRQLENIIERAIILSDADTIQPHHLPNHICQVPLGVEDIDGGEMTLAEIEKRHIYRILAKVDNNKTEAARILGINQATLYRKLNQYTRAPQNHP